MENRQTPLTKRTRIDKNNDQSRTRNESFTPAKRGLFDSKVALKTPIKGESTPSNKGTSRCIQDVSKSAQTVHSHTPRLKVSDKKMIKICVAVRFCPIVRKEEIRENDCIPFKLNDKSIVVKHGITCDASSGMSSTYTYDNIFWSSHDNLYTYSSQKCVFNEVAMPLLEAALQGFNACLFAYGQTGSGKTYSMMGKNNLLDGEDVGIIPRFCDELLRKTQSQQSQLLVNLSYYEIYNEKIHDLLSSSSDKENKTFLKVREHPITGPYVEDLSSHRVNTLNNLNALLVLGNSRRAIGSTFYNDRSSRSHTILEIILSLSTGAQTVHSKISLVDLAGSERISHCQVSDERFKEGLSINKSLLTLGKVISSFSDMKRGAFIPYRESVLTWLLKESLGGNSRTVMLATVSPSPSAIEESMATLRYACQARHILNKVAVNEDPQIKVIRELKEEIERLKYVKEDYVKNSQSNCNSKTYLSGNTPEDKSKLRQYNLTHIEIKQKAVEDQLKIELSRLGTNLEFAEKRCDELESEKVALISKLKNDNVATYKSNFFENLNSLLNESVEEASPLFQSVLNDNNNQLFSNLEHINVSLKALQELISSTNANDSICLGRARKVLLNMQRDYQELHEILVVNSI